MRTFGTSCSGAPFRQTRELTCEPESEAICHDHLLIRLGGKDGLILLPNTTYDWQYHGAGRKTEYSCTALKSGSKALFTSYAGSDVTRSTWHFKDSGVELDYGEVHYWYV